MNEIIDRHFEDNSDKLVDRLNDFYKNNPDDIASIEVLELIFIGGSDLVFWSRDKDGYSLAIDTLMENILPFEIYDELYEENIDNYEGIILEKIKEWTYKSWNKIDPKYKKKPIVFSEHDDTKIFWFNKSKWIENSDVNYVKYFNMKE